VDRKTAVWVQPPPVPVMRLVSPLMRRLLRSPLASRLPPALTLLEFAGRRSGRRFAVPVGVHEVQDGSVVFTEAGWRRNFAGGPEVTVRRGMKTSFGWHGAWSVSSSTSELTSPCLVRPEAARR